MMNVVLVHGFNIRDGGRSTIDTLIPYLSRNHTILQADYGWLGLIGVKLCGGVIAKVIAGMTPYSAIGIGHSNGCMELIKACEKGASFDHLIFINPALDNNIVIPPQVSRVDVLHNVTDMVVSAAKWLPLSYWGDMGRVGYLGSDTRVYNHETFKMFNVEDHSGVFTKPEEVSIFIEGLMQ